MIKALYIFLLLILFIPDIQGRDDQSARVDCDTAITILELRDSIYLYQMDEIVIFAKHSSKHKRNIQQYQKLERRVKKVYPYAIVLKNRIAELEKELLTVEKRKDQKKKIEEAEKELFDDFEAIVWKMTLSEGKILVKLIDRELGRSSFQIIRDYRGSFKAYFWQSLSLLFGNNLNVKYDTEHKVEDRQIENIINRIESGEIPIDTNLTKK